MAQYTASSYRNAQLSQLDLVFVWDWRTLCVWCKHWLFSWRQRSVCREKARDRADSTEMGPGSFQVIQVVSKLSLSWVKIVPMLSHSCLKVVPKLYHSGFWVLALSRSSTTTPTVAWMEAPLKYFPADLPNERFPAAACVCQPKIRRTPSKITKNTPYLIQRDRLSFWQKISIFFRKFNIIFVPPGWNYFLRRKCQRMLIVLAGS